MPSYNEIWNFYVEVFHAIKAALPNAILRHDEYYKKSNYYTPTPRTTIECDGYSLGEIMVDKDQCSPARYFSYYTGVTGRGGFYGQPSVQTVVESFVLMHKLRTHTITEEEAVQIGIKLKIKEEAIRFYFH